MDSSCYMGLYSASLSDANLFCDQVPKCLVGIEQRRCLYDEVDVAIFAETPVEDTKKLVREIAPWYITTAWRCQARM